MRWINSHTCMCNKEAVNDNVEIRRETLNCGNASQVCTTVEQEGLLLSLMMLPCHTLMKLFLP